MRKSMIAALAVGACLTSVPTLAANPTNGTATVNGTASRPSERNSLLADNGDVRMSKLVGTSVYNDQDKKVGSVDDVLIGQNGQPIVIMSVKHKYVEVPWNKLQFGDAEKNSDNKVIMPGATEDALANAPEFHYQENGRS
jgi:ribosomal 30S subunit maturation factor RimM